jgi:hypothetical protein
MTSLQVHVGVADQCSESEATHEATIPKITELVANMRPFV